MTKKFNNPNPDEDFDDAFALFDEDGDGMITRDELYKVLVQAGIPNLKLTDVDVMMSEVDPMSQGFIDKN